MSENISCNSLVSDAGIRRRAPGTAFGLIAPGLPEMVRGMREDIGKILYHELTILSRIDEMAAQITADYEGKDLTIISILNGSFIFASDLIRRIPLPLQIDCLGVSSYHGTESAGQITFRQLQVADVKGRHLLVLDDILDTGVTLHAIREKFEREAGALSLKVCVLLRKDVERKREIEAEYVGFDIPNEFVVGYGLDYNERYRNLPYIGVLTPEAIARGA